MKREQSRKTPGQWQLLFDRLAQSGQTWDQFCQEQGISLSIFRRWRPQLRKQISVKLSPHEFQLFIELTPAVRDERVWFDAFFQCKSMPLSVEYL